MTPEKKVCRRCKQEKLLTEFHKRGKRGYQQWCKTCRSEYDHARWAANSHRHLTIRQDRKRSLAIWLWEMKRGHLCADCGRSFHPVAMQWDHTATDKEINISRAVNSGWSRTRILRELAKCELACANCHAIRTYIRKRNTDPADEECYSYLRESEVAGSNPVTPDGV